MPASEHPIHPSRTTTHPPACAVFALFLSAAASCDTTRLADSRTHWLANTGGRPDNHIQNFVTDLAVYYPKAYEGPQRSGPLVLTNSWWDEGHCAICSYADGMQVGKAESWKSAIRSDSVTFGSVRCQLRNFWGRWFFTTQTPVPTAGSNAPMVTCSNGDTIRYPAVLDPSAIAFDKAGRLLVGENGPDQNIRIFRLGPARQIGSFGDSGGIFARSRPGSSPSYRPGQVGPRRFWGVRGIAVDSTGNLYVACSGLPMQTMGGTHIRAFSGKDSSLMWEVHGLSFVNTADADPDSGGSSVYLNAKRFHMDYSLPPGRSWSFEAATLDPFRFPDDPRLKNPMETVWVRRIGGRMFQYYTDMVGGFFAMVRFTDTSEIGIPTAFFCTNSDRQEGWGTDMAPTWTRNEDNKRLRWYWLDENGDGAAQKSEFHTYENWSGMNQALDVDEDGDVWLGADGPINRSSRDGGVTRFHLSSIGAAGVPEFTTDSIRRYDVPFREGNGHVTRMKYLSRRKTALLAKGPNTWYSDRILVYPGYPESSTASCSIDLGYDDLDSTGIHLDQGTAGMTLPWSFTADSQYVYVTYLDNGRWSRRRGEVSVYDLSTCAPLGWLGPDLETGWTAGATDIVNALNATTRPDGSRVVFAEDDGAGKVMAHHWKPPVDTHTVPVPTPSGAWVARSSRHHLDLYGPVDGGTADLFDRSGRRLARWTLPPTGGERRWMRLSGILASSGFLSVHADGRRQTFQVVLAE